MRLETTSSLCFEPWGRGGGRFSIEMTAEEASFCPITIKAQTSLGALLTLLRNIPSIYCLLRYYAVTPHTSQWILRLLRCYRPLLRHECPNNLSLIMLLRSTFNVVSLLQYERPKNLSLISYCAVTLRCQCYERPKHPSLKDAKNPLLSFVRFCRMFTWSQGAYNKGLKSCPVAGLRLKQEETESWC